MGDLIKKAAAMIKPLRGKRTVWAAMLVLSLLLLGSVFFQRDLLHQGRSYTFQSVSEMRFGQGDRTIVIDSGKKTLLLLDGEGRLLQRFDGGTNNAPFFYACHAAEAPDGSLYVADIVYGNRGNLLEKEHILKFSGSRSKVVFEVDYTGLPEEEIPLQYGRILELQEYGGMVYFILSGPEKAELYRIEKDDSLTLLHSVPLTGLLNDAAYDAESGQLIFSYRGGDVVLWDPEQGRGETVLSGGDHIAWDLAARNGQVYFTEVTEKCIWYFPVENPGALRRFYSDGSVLFKLDVSSDGSRVLTTDYGGFYRLAPGADETVEAVYISEAPLVYFSRVILTWTCLVLGAGLLLVLLSRMISRLVRALVGNESRIRIVYIVMASLAVSFILSYSLLERFLDSSTAFSEKQVELFSEILLTDLDTEELLNIREPGDYRGESYTAVKGALDRHVRRSYGRGDYYYYIIYRVGDGTIAAIMDYEESAPCWNPVYPYGMSPYTEVLETGEEIIYSENSAYGAWTFVLTPIRDAGGKIVAELEVGQSLDAINAQQRELILELVISVSISTVVITMLLLELSFLLSFTEQRNTSWISIDSPDPTDQVPLRTLVFFSYVADSMQDAFIAVLLSELYDGFLPIAEGVAVALPMSIQLLAMAVFSLFGGSLVGRYGMKNGLVAGFTLEMSGFLLCLLTGSYAGILVGKLLIGTGMGIVYVSCNTIASMGKDEAHTESAFAGVSAGVLSGITIGAGLSSVLLSLGGYRLIFLLGTALEALALIVVVSSVPPLRGDSASEAERATGRLSALQFLTRPRILGFFAFLLIPFMMSLSFREYLFPLYVSEHGLTELQIARIYLVCGLMVLYIGPSLSAWLIRSFGPKASVTASSVLLVLDMGIFVLHPSLGTVIAGVVILSFIVSFAYTCQYTYFDSLHEIEEYGNGAAMGIYSMMESFGQTLGPVVYGAMLTLGYRTGILTFTLLMALAVAAFLILSSGRGKKQAEGGR